MPVADKGRRARGTIPKGGICNSRQVRIYPYADRNANVIILNYPSSYMQVFSTASFVFARKNAATNLLLLNDQR